MRFLRAAIVLTSFVASIGASTHAEAAVSLVPVEPNQPLTEALEAYRAAGVRIVYSTGVVSGRYRVQVLPDPSATLTTQIATLLAPHGLALIPGVDDVWVVVVDSTSLPDPEPVAQVPASDPAIPMIEEVLVTAAHHRLIRNTASAQSLTNQQIDDAPGIGRDLFRAVTTLPGQATDGLTARQKIRGGNENEVLYLLDGTQLIAPFHMDGFFSPFGVLNTNVIDAVDVYNSGYPARFGTRSSGVLDLTIRGAEKPFSGTVDANLMRLAAHAQGASGNWQWLASARRGTLDYLLRQLHEDYGEPEFNDQMLRIEHGGATRRLIVGLMNSRDEVFLRNPSIHEEGSNDRQNLMVWAVSDFLPAPGTQVVGRASYNRIRSDRGGTLDNPVDAVGNMDGSSLVEILRISGELTRALSDRFRLRGGFEIQQHKGDFRGELNSVYGLLGQPVQEYPELHRRFDVSRKGDITALYASISGRLHPRLEAELGLRYDNQDIDPVHEDQLSPRLQLNFKVSDRFSLFLNAGRYSQHQYLFEVPLDDGLLTLAPPQVTDQLSIGSRFSLGSSIQVLIEAYGKRIRDPQPRSDNLYDRYVLLPEIHGDRVLLLPEKARATGVEVSVAGQLLDRLDWRLGYVHADVSERIGGDWRPRPWDQRNSFRGQLGWSGTRWRAALHMVYHDGWATTDLVLDPGTGIDAYNNARLKSYFSIDASVSRIWRWQKSTLEAYVQISNLSNRSNVGGYDYSLDEAEWQGKARSLLPVLPVLGLKYAW